MQRYKNKEELGKHDKTKREQTQFQLLTLKKFIKIQGNIGRQLNEIWKKYNKSFD